MTNQRFVSYLRVSTNRQGISGLGLEAQREAVSAFIQMTSGALVAEFEEIESGKRSDRPKLEAALRLCRLHQSTLLIAKLDRLARNVAFISNLMESGVEFVAADFPQANRLTVHVLAAVAEYEATAVSLRTKAALTAAKARGIELGGDRGNFLQIASLGPLRSAQVRSDRLEQRLADLRPIVQMLRDKGSS